ncbi:MAG: DNA internalization-related competence protein ComEC/Rec2 [Dehalococcoidales bacterium]
MVLLCLGISWIIGIVIGLNFDLPPVLILTGLLPLPLLFLKKHRKQIILAAIFITALFSASFWAHNALPKDDWSYINYFNDKGTVIVSGVIGDDPDIREASTRLFVKTSLVEINGTQFEVEGNVLVFVPRYPAYSYGDKLKLSGELKTPPVFDGFDYAAYLSHENIYSTMLYPQTELIETEQGFSPLKQIYLLRGKLSQSLAKVLPEPQASLARAMLLGIRSGIPDDLKQDFSLTGTAHLLAISGLHTGIVAGLMIAIGLALFGRKNYLYVWLALGVIWLYAVLTGLQAPVVRSVIMASIFLAAELTGRQRNAITALVFAAAIMAACDPQVLYTASFQMSFAAMGGLIFVLPPLQNVGKKLIGKLTIKSTGILSFLNVVYDGLAVSFAALVGVLPLIAYYFGIVSTVSSIATLLVLPVLAAIIILGTLTAFSGLFFLPLSQFLGWLLWLILSYMILIVKGFGGLSLAYFEVSGFGLVYLWGYYIAVAIVIWLGNKYKFGVKTEDNKTELSQLSLAKNSPKEKTNQAFFLRRPFKFAAVTIIVVTVFSIIIASSAPDHNLHVSFLDVGQGDAVLIQKGSTQILVDGGPERQLINLELSRKMPFWDRTIELVILTHPHDDHITGQTEVLQRYKVGHILTTDSASGIPVYKEWAELISANNIPLTFAQSGQQIVFDGVIIDIINPQQAYFTNTGADADNNGIVMTVTFGETVFLLTADTGKYTELELIKDRLIPQVTVLKVGHHGSKTSSSAEFLNVCRPQIAVISVGEANKYGHPDTEVSDRLADMVGEENIYRTDINGTIEFISDGTNLWLVADYW